MATDTNPDSDRTQQARHTDVRGHIAADFGYECHDCGRDAVTFVQTPRPRLRQSRTDLDATTEPFCNECATGYLEAGGHEFAPMNTHGLARKHRTSVRTFDIYNSEQEALAISPERLWYTKGIRGFQHPDEPALPDGLSDSLSGVVDLDDWR